ncbi:MAG TPA: divalent-cation tolerance protein CutA [Firmicutes bacterium]|nr:divalent-cation tolerance protein CutA [Bacillota bacterium]
MTAASREQAMGLARSLVERRLAACVNILGEIGSYYWWNGKLCDEKEVALIAKTPANRLDELVTAVKDMHEYEVPAIIAIPAVGGNPDFLEWVVRETLPPV